MKRIFAFLSVPILAASLSGCGPGFPIMTGEQEQLIHNVEGLMKENQDLKTRVAGLEEGGGSGQIKDGLEAVKSSVAQTNMSIDKLREDLSSVRGAIEDGTHDREQLKESLKNASSSSMSVNERLASIEAGLQEAGKRIEAYEALRQEDEKRIGEIRDAITAVEKKTAAVEKAAREAVKEASKQEPRQDAPKDDPEALYQKAYKYTSSKDYPNATEAFHKFLAAFPAHKYAVNAQYWLGEIYYAKGDWEMAILEFDKVIKKYPGSEKTPASVLKQGFAFDKLGSRKEARVLLQEVVDKYPESPEASIAKKRLKSMK